MDLVTYSWNSHLFIFDWYELLLLGLFHPFKVFKLLIYSFQIGERT
jgi:hypothetical protein